MELTKQSAATVVNAELLKTAANFAAQAKAENTRRAYATDWRLFGAWCSTQGLEARPASPATVAAYIAALANEGKKVATIERALVSIAHAHKVVGLDPPTRHPAVQEVRKGLRRVLGTAQRQVAPVDVELLRAALEAFGDELLGLRNRALLLLGFAGAFRRSELVGLDVEDLTFTTDGLVVVLRRSKTDQEGQGRKVGIPYGGNPMTCPVRATKAWLEAAQLTAGALFREAGKGHVEAARLGARSVAHVVKRAAQLAGFDPERFAGHSLRAGLVTVAARAGKGEREIMKQTGHRSEKMVRRYIRDAGLFDENAAVGIGL